MTGDATSKPPTNPAKSLHISWSEEELAAIASEIERNNDCKSPSTDNSLSENLKEALVHTVASLSINPLPLSSRESEPAEPSLQAVLGLLSQTEVDRTSAKIRRALASVYWFNYLEQRIQLSMQHYSLPEREASSNYNYYKQEEMKSIWALLNLDEKNATGQRKIKRLKERLVEGKRFSELGELCGPAVLAFRFNRLKHGER